MKAIGGDFASVYGEITGRGFACLAEQLRLGPDDVFVDCGSGHGLAVTQAAREFGVRHSYGVELAASRHEQAVARLADHAACEGAASCIQMLHGDCADAALWRGGGELSTCTCLYTCNILFDEALNARLRRRIAGCPSIRCVAAFERWPEGLDGFAEPYEMLCETSWSPLRQTRTWDAASGLWEDDGGSPVYIYERSDPSFLQRATSGRLTFVALIVVKLASVCLPLS